MQCPFIEPESNVSKEGNKRVNYADFGGAEPPKDWGLTGPGGLKPVPAPGPVDGLLPCPFCGDPNPTFTYGGDGMGGALVFVCCHTCDAQSDYAEAESVEECKATDEAKAKVRALWNRRASPAPSADAVREALMEARRVIAHDRDNKTRSGVGSSISIRRIDTLLTKIAAALVGKEP